MLPKLPYVMKKNRQQTVAMRGINFSNATADGDIADSKGIGLQAYPYLATRKGRARAFEESENVIDPEGEGENVGAAEGESSEVIDFTYFWGSKVEVRAEDDGNAGLYYDGGRVCDVTPGKKQFATINTKLVIFPDKIYFERSGRWNYLGAKRKAYHATFAKNYVSLGATVSDVFSGFGGEFEGNTFTAKRWGERKLLVGGKTAREVTHFCNDGEDVIQQVRYFEQVAFHDKNHSPVSSRRIRSGSDDLGDYDVHEIYHTIPWEYVNEDILNIKNLHDKTSFSGTFIKYPLFVSSPNWIDVITAENTSHGYRFSYEIRTESGVEPERKQLSYVYRLVDLTKDKIVDTEAEGPKYVVMTSPSGSSEAYLVETEMPHNTRYERAGSFLVRIKPNETPLEGAYNVALFTSGWANVNFREYFSSGARVIFSGNYKDPENKHLKTDIKNNDFSAIIENVTAESITIKTVVDAEGGEESGETEGEVVNEIVFEDEDLDNAYITLYSDVAADFGEFKIGDAVTISGSSVAENNTTFIIDKIDGSTFYSASEIFTESEQDVVLTIEREIPKLDFICEKDNRLWGCSNKDSTIYSSALGDPTNIYAYKDLSTDSYAVAVASSGDFTACCRYGDAVLFWKQDKLYKLLGSYPSEYALYDYDIDGVQAGAHESIAIINEALYYKGVHGVYVYRGGTPQLISQNFGDRRFEGGTGGGYGNRYYFSTSDGERDYLFVYDTLLGMWALEDDIRVRTFFRKDGDELYMLAEGGEVYLCDAGESETGIEWFVQFTPFYETIEGCKSYSRIKLRVEVPQGSYMAVSVRCDGGRWHECGKIVGKNAGVIPVAIPINRCDKFEIKLSGKGKCTILSMMREFYVGSDNR